MYLSRLILNPRSRRVQKETSDPYQMHRTVMRAFPDSLAAGSERVLFRLDTHPRTGALTLLVQSLTEPDWSWLKGPDSGNYLLPMAEEINPGVKSFEPAFAAGQILVFRLRANPAVKRKFANGEHKRVGIYDEARQIGWLMRKGEQGGFEILTVRVSGCSPVKATISGRGGSHQAQILGVQFDGVLRVTNPVPFQETIRRGIGSAKGLGFGLLSVARVP